MARRVSKSLRVMVLANAECVPPEDYDELSKKDQEQYRTEADVLRALQNLGHHVYVVPLEDELAVLRRAIEVVKPDVAFNLVEEFHGTAIYDQNVVAYLELMKVPYTGCNPRGLVIGRDKALSKKILSYHRIRFPGFAVFRRGRSVARPPRLRFPLIVKSLTEDASAGIAEASVVQSEDKLAERVAFVHDNLETHAIVEEYIDGRETYVGLLGGDRITVLPTWELFMDNLRPDAPRIFTLRAKWDTQFQRQRGFRIGPAQDFTDEQQKMMGRIAKRIYRALNLSGYARLDFRLDAEGRPYFLEANPNPDISDDGEIAQAAASVGMAYDQLIHRIVTLGQRSLPR
jgi:D-alanine-D-alanine ligase